MSERVENLGRGSAVIAVSTGLVASMAVPASAMAQPLFDKASPQTASVPLGESAPRSGAQQAVVVAGQLDAAQLGASGPLSAPSTATVQFDSGALTASHSVATALSARNQARASRSAARSAVVPKAAAPKAAARSAAAPKAAVSPTAALPAARGSAVLSLASRYVGVMYRYGGSRPSGFDCSGYTQYVYKQLGVTLPRTAQQQLASVRRIPRSEAVPGDLVFVVYGGYASHVGIYAGNGMMYDSPRSGKAISKRKIWSSSVVFGRPTR